MKGKEREPEWENDIWGVNMFFFYYFLCIFKLSILSMYYCHNQIGKQLKKTIYCNIMAKFEPKC